MGDYFLNNSERSYWERLSEEEQGFIDTVFNCAILGVIAMLIVMCDIHNRSMGCVMKKIKNVLLVIHDWFWSFLDKTKEVFNVLSWFRPILLILSKRGNNIGRWAFGLLMVLTYGRKLTDWASSQHRKIDAVVDKFNPQLQLRGVKLNSRSKARAFDRAAKSELMKENKTISEVEEMIPKLREDIVKFKNWFDEDKIEAQNVRIQLEGGKPLPYNEMLDSEPIKKTVRKERKEKEREEGEEKEKENNRIRVGKTNRRR